MNKLLFTSSLALKAIWRRRQRNIFAVLIIAAAVTGLILFHSLVDRIFWGVRESTIHSQTGHLQITHRDAEQAAKGHELSALLNDTDDLLQVISSLQHVRAVTTRLDFSGLVGTGATSTVFNAQAVDPSTDTLISSFEQVITGTSLHDGDRQATPVVLGEGLAKSLNAKPGSDLLLMTRSVNAGLNAIDVKVTGITRSDSLHHDQLSLKIPLSAARDLVGTNGVSRIVVLLDDTESTLAIKKQIQKILDSRGLDYRINDWKSLNPSYEKIVGLYSRIFFIFGLMLFIVVILALSNTLLMGYMERTRELSVMRAIGASPSFLARLFAVESLLVGLVGGISGCLVSWLAINVMTNVFDGISMPPPPGSDQPFRLRPSVNLYAMGVILLCTAATSLLASIAPSRRISALSLMAGMREQ